MRPRLTSASYLFSFRVSNFSFANFIFASQVALYHASASDKERIALACVWQEKDEAVAKMGKAEGLASRAKIKVDQFRKSCEAKDQKNCPSSG